MFVKGVVKWQTHKMNKKNKTTHKICKGQIFKEFQTFSIFIFLFMGCANGISG